MKKIITFITSLFFCFICLSISSVSASVTIYETDCEAIDINGNQIPLSDVVNGIRQPGIIISPFDFITEDCINLDEVKEVSLLFAKYDPNITYLIGDTDYDYEALQEDLNNGSINYEDIYLKTAADYYFPFVYIVNIYQFEKYLKDNEYITDVETFTDLEFSSHVKKYEILEYALTNNYAYIVPKNNLPTLLYVYNNITLDSILEKNYYTINDYYYLYTVEVGDWINFAYSLDNEDSSIKSEETKFEIEDSLGKFYSISSNTFVYKYLPLSYSTTQGYYVPNLHDEQFKIINVSFNQVPGFCFDDSGNLRDIEVCILDNVSYEAIVKDYSTVLLSNWGYEVINPGLTYPYEAFICYFNFDKDLDCINSLDFNLTFVKKSFWDKILHAFTSKDFEEITYHSVVTKDDMVDYYNKTLRLPVSTPFLPGWQLYFDFSYDKVTSKAIQKGDYEVNGINYQYKTYFYDSSVESVKNLDENLTWFIKSANMSPADLLILEINYNYRGITFTEEDIVSTPNFDDPRDDKTLWERVVDILTKISTTVKDFLSNSIPLWLKIVLILVLVGIVVYFIVRFVYYLKNIKSKQ